MIVHNKPKGDASMKNEENITKVRDGDKVLIRAFEQLSPEKKFLVKGFLIGIGLQDKTAEEKRQA
jgi:ribosomal protein S17